VVASAGQQHIDRSTSIDPSARTLIPAWHASRASGDLEREPGYETGGSIRIGGPDASYSPARL
jgi:hypothetical protein